MASQHEANDRTATRTEEVYQRLRQEIVRGDLRPREALSEVEIAERLRVSRTPVRESLQRLASEGLIRSHRRRWVVYEHTTAEIQEIYEVRTALEGYSARLAAKRATDAELVALRELRDQVRDASPELDQRVAFNEQLHDGILALAHNETLLKQARTSRRYFFNRTVAQLYTPAELAVSAEQHRELLGAVIARDADEAERLARQHVDFALDVILHRLR
ncbi:GntR family transcriptional regulator [Saccharopolyspora sp. K220]|uniref:GntR family transcriptional regulator n=1 Tax=Saccharopolyspora soli TaxID=2926618 RepID=UPI001F58C8A8|nr:GntR family transcriptional regulator [Saccharopolyspora soli]MCI2418292.1 GntR family transcriptional regulator [Saccharopolyspora soli]